MSSHLREATAQAHDAAATSFALDARLERRDAYADLLLCLREFSVPVEAALLTVAGWRRLAPVVEIGSRCRAALLDGDLRSLGIAVPREVAASAPFALPSVAGARATFSALGARLDDAGPTP